MGCRDACGEEGWCRGQSCDNRRDRTEVNKGKEHPTVENSGEMKVREKDREEGPIKSTLESAAFKSSTVLPINGRSSTKSKEETWLYRGKEVNLSKFLRYHPGGTPTLTRNRNDDLEPSMKATHHSAEAYYLLNDMSEENAVERIVDWNKPMLSQVGSLGPLYETWVWSPVDRPLRLFQSDWLERLTRTNWQQVVGTWVPVISMAAALSLFHAPDSLTIELRMLLMLLLFSSGMAVWPLLEYSIHRWIFHLQPPKNSSLLITLHFGLHGLHHKVPFDEGRLLFPPGPCSVMAIALYQIYTRLAPWWIAMALFSGTMLGYLIYDLIHYYLHHGNPKEDTYLYHMKRYHNRHHFAQQEKGFGISTDFWDHAFDTLVKLKKLSKPLSWERS